MTKYYTPNDAAHGNSGHLISSTGSGISSFLQTDRQTVTQYYTPNDAAHGNSGHLISSTGSGISSF